ncbi:MAG TPA: hypothetical protein VFC45_14975 [Pseudolabrys sp.]|nr:hypothetical protein [Pseudolabrys sp.]
MRKITLTIATLAAIGFVLPVMPASAENAVIIKTDRDHDRDWQRHQHHKKIVVLKTHHDRDHDHDRN